MNSFVFVLRRHKTAFFVILLMGLVVNTVMTLLPPVFLKHLFDRCVAAKDMYLFVLLLTGFIALATMSRALNLFLNLKTQKLKHVILREFVQDMLRKYYRLSYLDTARLGPGYYVSRIFDEPLAVSTATIDLALDIVAGAVSFLASLILLTLLSTQATMLLAACVPFLIFLADKYGSAVMRHADAEKEEEGQLRGFLTKAAQAYRNVRLFGLGDRVAAGLDARLTLFMGAASERFKSSCLHNTIGGILMSYAEVLVIVVCGHEMMRGRMTFGGFMAFMSGFWTAVNSLRSLTQKVPEIAKNTSLVQRMRDFQSSSQRVDAGIIASDTLSFENVGFKYGENKVFSNLSFTVGKTDKVLLSGRNGSGKSTVANILSSFLSPMQGEVRIFNMERVSACLTPQHFIPGTVRDNLGYEKLTESRKIYLGSLLNDFGLEGILDSDPEELSSGQRKKLALIMGLMKDADLYVLDEPLANVDTDSKANILRRIFERTANKALVVTMHGDEHLKTRFNKVVELVSANNSLLLPLS